MTEKHQQRRVFLKRFGAMAIGNLLEWFDFSCFGALIDVLATNFFPSGENDSLTLLKGLAVFGAAFVMRPVGGVVLGWIGDSFGRKKALELSILLMLFPSFLIGCLPTYYDIGSTASVLLVLLRLLQGMAAGGELVGAFLYTLEAAEDNSRGFWGGACKASGNLGTTLGLGLVTLLRYTLTKDQLYAWGWRIPFWFGIIFGSIGVYARSKLKGEAGGDGTEYERAKLNNEIGHSPLRHVLQNYWKEILVTVGAASFWCCCYYTSFIWLVYYMQDPDLIGGNGVPGAWIINLISNLLLVLALPLGGFIGDRFGSTMNDYEAGALMAMKLSIFILITVAIPSFILFITRNPSAVGIGQFFLLIPIALFGANLPSFMVSQFPVALRYLGVGIGYNLAHALFSSTAPIIQTALILERAPWDETNTQHRVRSALYLIDDPRLYPAFYLMGISIFTYLMISMGTYFLERSRKEKAQEELRLMNPIFRERAISTEDREIYL